MTAMKLFASLAALVVIALPLISLAARAQPQPSPFFAAFQRFCADPGMSPQKIRLAVEAAGGKLVGAPGSTDVPQPMYVAGWNVMMQGHSFLVTAGGVRAPRGLNMIQNSVSCSVVGDDSDGAALEELKHWVMVAPLVRDRPFMISNGTARNACRCPPAKPFAPTTMPARSGGLILSAAANTPM
jgi:hypothetical protein